MATEEREISIRGIHLYSTNNRVASLKSSLITENSAKITSYISYAQLSANFKLNANDDSNIVSIDPNGSLTIDFGKKMNI